MFCGVRASVWTLWAEDRRFGRGRIGRGRIGRGRIDRGADGFQRRGGSEQSPRKHMCPSHLFCTCACQINPPPPSAGTPADQRGQAGQFESARPAGARAGRASASAAQEARQQRRVRCHRAD
eukprot:366046-Chlamydomonas_euryale.AAC.6